MFRHAKRLLPALFAASTFAACQGEPIGSDVDCANCTEVPPISASSVVECWFEAKAEAASLLQCELNLPESYPTTLSGADIAIEEASGRIITKRISFLDQGAATNIATLSPVSFPVDLSVDVLFDTRDNRVPALHGLERVRSRFRMSAPENAPIADPLRADIPFELWPVDILSRNFDYAAVSTGYEIDVGMEEPYRVGIKTRPLFYGHSEEHYLPMPAQRAEVEGLLSSASGAMSEFVIDQPGAYVITDDKLRYASPDEGAVSSEGSQLAHCYVKPIDTRSDALYCGAAANGGLADGAILTLETALGKDLEVSLTQVSRQIATVSKLAYPITMQVVGQIDHEIIGLDTIRPGAAIEVSTVLEAGNRQEAPSYFKAPFSVWTVRVDNRSEGFEGVLDTYILELGHSVEDQFASLVEGAELPAVGKDEIAAIRVASPAGEFALRGSGSITRNGVSEEVDFLLRPGNFIIGE